MQHGMHTAPRMLLEMSVLVNYPPLLNTMTEHSSLRSKDTSCIHAAPPSYCMPCYAGPHPPGIFALALRTARATNAEQLSGKACSPAFLASLAKIELAAYHPSRFKLLNRNKDWQAGRSTP